LVRRARTVSYTTSACRRPDHEANHDPDPNTHPYPHPSPKRLYMRNSRRAVRETASISPIQSPPELLISPLYLPYTSPTPPLHLPRLTSPSITRGTMSRGTRAVPSWLALTLTNPSEGDYVNQRPRTGYDCKAVHSVYLLRCAWFTSSRCTHRTNPCITNFSIKPRPYSTQSRSRE